MKSKITTLLLISAFLLFPVQTFAVDTSPSPTAASTPVSPSNPGKGPKNHLPEGKLRACQAREDTIKRRMTHLQQLATNMENKFDTIAGRVETFYTSKLVPQGKTLPDYAVLLADINTKKTAVQTTLTNAQTDSASFSCTGGDPKSLFNKFRQDMQAVIRALKDYRTSIKNLIVAVHSLVGNPKGSPGVTPSVVPSATPGVTGSPSPTPLATPSPTATVVPTATP